MPTNDETSDSALEYCVEWSRPDGWWEAGRGWNDPEQAARDAADQLAKHVSWRVVRAAKRPKRAFLGIPRGGVMAASDPDEVTEPSSRASDREASRGRRECH